MGRVSGVMRSRRLRWVGVAAAAALVLGATTSSNAAVTSGVRNVYVPISPCRLADTRPAPDTVGAKNTPLGAAATMTLNGRGASGQCTLPTDGTALVLNVTTLNATASSFLTIWPTGLTRPLASSLNPSPGAPPTPNAVTTPLSASGQFNIYNNSGSVNVIVDVVGYYSDHNFDDRYVRKTTPQPIAMGVINSGASSLSGWGYTTVIYNANSYYEITIPGHGISYSSYVTTVTPWGRCQGVANVDSISGHLLVYFVNSSGTNVQCGFDFVTYDPTP